MFHAEGKPMDEPPATGGANVEPVGTGHEDMYEE